MYIQKMRVLLVEQDWKNLVRIRRAFAAAAETGELHEVQNLQAARQHLTLTVPDVVIAALHLPDGTGTELVPSNAKDATYPVIILVSPDDTDALHDAMHAGAWDYALTSPMTLADLPHTTARTLRAWRYARQQRQLEQALQYRDAQFQRAQRHEAVAVAARLTAHDVNNSLSFILGYTQMALDETPPDSKTRRFLLEVQNAGQEAKERVQQFLTCGRSADQPFMRVPFRAMVTAVLQRVRDAYTVPLRLESSEDPGMVLANEAQLQQAFFYLYALAVHAINERGGGLTIHLDRVESDATWPTQHPELPPGCYLRMRVHPSSHAGLAEYEETYAEPTFRLGRSSGRADLELAIVRAIVASHHGVCDVPSAANQAFVVYLPQVAAGPPSHFQELGEM